MELIILVNSERVMGEKLVKGLIKVEILETLIEIEARVIHNNLIMNYNLKYYGSIH